MSRPLSSRQVTDSVVKPAAIFLALTNMEFSLHFKNVILPAGKLTVSLLDLFFSLNISSTKF